MLFSASIFRVSFPATTCSSHCVSVVQIRRCLHVCSVFMKVEPLGEAPVDGQALDGEAWVRRMLRDSGRET